MTFTTATAADEHPWVSPVAAPTPAERRRGLLAPVPAAIGRRARPRLVYAGLAVVAIIVIVCVQLGMSIAVSNGAYRLGALQTEKKQVGRSVQAASETVEKLSSPQLLAANADAMGMVSNGNPVYLRLSDGAVIGSPKAAVAGSGTVSGSPDTGLVPNALTAGIPLLSAGADAVKTAASGLAAPAAGAGSSANPQGSDKGTPGSNATAAPSGPIAWTGQLPSPTTH